MGLTYNGARDSGDPVLIINESNHPVHLLLVLFDEVSSIT
jgi:hypothetical protein